MRIQTPKGLKAQKDHEFARLVKERDNYKCVICSSNESHINAHHIIPKEIQEYRWDIDNGITLCAKHHRFYRIISAHQNSLAFFIWLKMNKPELFDKSEQRLIELLKKEGVINDNFR